MLLVWDILRSSTPHPEVNHGCASLAAFSLHMQTSESEKKITLHSFTRRLGLCKGVHVHVLHYVHALHHVCNKMRTHNAEQKRMP